MADAAVDSERSNPDEQPQRPEWLPENFDNPEALVKSYQEAQNKIREQGTQLSALNENYAELATQIEEMRTAPPQAPQQQGPDLIADYQQAYESGDYMRMLSVQDQLAAMRAQQIVNQALQPFQQQLPTLAEQQKAHAIDYAWNGLKDKYGQDFEAHREAMAEAIQQNEYLVPADSSDPRLIASALENVYKIVNPKAFVEPSPEQQAAQRQADALAMKQQAQSAVGAGGRPMSPDEASAEWDKIKSAASQPYWAGLAR